MADGSLTLVARPNMFEADALFCEVPAGQTLAQMLGEGASYACEVTVGGFPVPRELWGKVRPKAGQTIHATIYPQGGKAGKWVKVIAIAIISYYTMGGGSAAAASFFGVSTTTLGIIGMVAIMAVNALIPPPTPKGLGGGGGDPFQQLASITGTSNQANPYGVIPCVVGTKRFFPPHAALPYTEISGDDQYLRMLLDLGYGDLDISDIQIGETPIDSYEDVEYEISTAPSLFSQDIYELAVGVGLNASNDNAIRTTQTESTEISLDLIFGGGLYGVDEQNNTVTGSVQFFIEYRSVGDTTWLAAGSASGLTMTGGLKVPDAGSPNTFQINSTKRKTLRCGVRWKVASGQYEVKVMRWSSTFTGAVTGATVGDCAWSVLRSVNPQNPSTTGTTKLAVRIKATDQLNGVVSNLSVLASQKVRQLDADNAWTDPAATESPAWIYLWLMTQCPAVMRRVADERMDLAGIADWASECTTKGYKVGFVMDSPRAFGDVLRDVMAAGRASFGLRNGLYSAVRDIEQTVPVQMFTPANSWGFSYSRSFIEPPHALRVKFTNPEANDQQDVRVVYWDGYTAANATRFEELDLSMVIDPDAAWRLGRYHLSVMWLRPTQYSFQADIEHMVCERGDLVHVAHDITSWGLAWGRVKAVSGTTITLDGPVTLESGKTYQLRVRGEDGAQAIASVTGGVGGSEAITAQSTVFAVADGSTQYTLRDATGREVASGITVGAIHRTQWGARVRLYPTPRTNLALHSEDFSNAVWQASYSGTGSAAVVTPNYAAAPDGSMTACRVQLDLGAATGDQDWSAFQQDADSPDGTETGALWIKSNTGSNAKVYLYTLDALVLATVTPEWQRIEALETDPAQQDDGPTSTTADLLIWHPQVEVAAAPGVHIPTTNAPAALTDYARVGSTVTLTQTPEDGARLDWDGSGTVTVPTATLTLGTSIGAPGDLYVLGEVNHGVAKLIVRAIEPGEDYTATLTCVDADPGIWSADSGTPPAFVSDITGKPWCAPPDAPVVNIRAGDSAPDDAGVIHASTGISLPPIGGIYRNPKINRRDMR